MLINVKIPTIVGILIFNIMINTTFISLNSRKKVYIFIILLLWAVEILSSVVLSVISEPVFSKHLHNLWYIFEQSVYMEINISVRCFNFRSQNVQMKH